MLTLCPSHSYLNAAVFKLMLVAQAKLVLQTALELLFFRSDGPNLN